MKLLKDICEKHGVSLLMLSKRTGIPYRTLQDWMFGKAVPSAAGQAFLEHLLVCRMSLKRKKGIATPKL